MVLNFTSPAIQAIFHALSTTEAKGRVEVRVHSRLTKAINAECTEQSNGGTVAKAGKIELDETLFDYLKDAVHDRVDAGVPGSIAYGYGELLDLIEVPKAVEDKAPKAKSKV